VRVLTHKVLFISEIRNCNNDVFAAKINKYLCTMPGATAAGFAGWRRCVLMWRKITEKNDFLAKEGDRGALTR
jgi:hypothetical protein